MTDRRRDRRRDRPVVAVVDAAHLLAGLQQVQDAGRAAALLLHLGVARLDLWFDLRVDVQRLLVRRVHALIGRERGGVGQVVSYQVKMTFVK